MLAEFVNMKMEFDFFLDYVNQHRVAMLEIV